MTSIERISAQPSKDITIGKKDDVRAYSLDQQSIWLIPRIALDLTLKNSSTQRPIDRSISFRTEASKGSQIERSPGLKRYLGEVNRWEGFLAGEHDNNNSEQTIRYLEEWNRKWKESSTEQPLRKPVWLPC